MPSVTITLTTDRDFTLVSLVGDIKELGAWNPALGLPMKATPSSSPPGRHTYTGVLLLATPPPSQSLQFKCVGRESGGGASSPWVWEGGENHTLAIPPSSTLPLDYHVSWCVEDECGLGVIKGDGYLRDFIPALRARQGALVTALASIEEQGGLDAFSRGHLYYGFTRGGGGGGSTPTPSPPGIHFREWAPGALEVSLVGDFNAWDPAATPLTRDAYGVWSTFLPDPSPGVEAIAHDTFVRLSVVIAGGQRVNRLPAYIRYTVRDERLNEYVGKYWNPPPSQRHTWRHPRPFTSAADDYSGKFPFAPSIPSSASDATGSVAAVGVVGVGKSTAPPAPAAPKPLSTATAAAAAAAGGTRVTSTGGALPATPPTLSSSPSHPSSTSSDPAASGLRIYESHVGIAGEEGKVSSYRDFAHNVIPRIKKLGYNCGECVCVLFFPRAVGGAHLDGCHVSFF